MLIQLRRFMKREGGATAIEYSLIAALVSVAAISGMESLGGSLSEMFTNVGEQLNNVSTTGSSSGSSTTGG